ncbi:transformation/transcription domain-associated protein [Tanacetum coccineum]|uniref:Neutral ceramidase n=1 Tax=Tanacetum coccineum TaxID=301880 RepID=A0ABQ5HDJ5_9ASTR
MIVSSPSMSPVYSPPPSVRVLGFDRLLPRLLHCWYEFTWQAQMGGVIGLGALVGKVIVETLYVFQVRVVRGPVFVLKRLHDYAAKELEETSQVLSQVFWCLDVLIFLQWTGTDTILGREDTAFDSRIEVKVPMCFYDVLAVQLDNADVLLRYSSALLQGAINNFARNVRPPEFSKPPHGFPSSLTRTEEVVSASYWMNLRARIIGECQFQKSAELFQSASEQLKGKVGYRHSYINFSDLSVRFSNVNESVRTCPAAMGFAFTAGTTDGPDEKQIKCQDPKPILIDSGEMHEPYDWATGDWSHYRMPLIGNLSNSSDDLIDPAIMVVGRGKSPSFDMRSSSSDEEIKRWLLMQQQQSASTTQYHPQPQFSQTSYIQQHNTPYFPSSYDNYYNDLAFRFEDQRHQRYT